MFFCEYDYETDIRVQRQEAFEDGLAEGIKQGIEQGAEQTKIETAKNALKNNIPIEMIVKITGLTENKVLELQEEIGKKKELN